MFSYTDITSIAAGGSIPCNGSATDSLQISPMRSQGLGGRQKRTTIYDRGQQHGYLIPGTQFRKGEHIVIVGFIDIRSSGTEAGIVAARNAFMQNVAAVLDAMDVAGVFGTVTFGSGGTKSVKNDTGYDFFSWDEKGPLAKGVQFGLVTLV